MSATELGMQSHDLNVLQNVFFPPYVRVTNTLARLTIWENYLLDIYVLGV